jgi:hypothetical protein
LEEIEIKGHKLEKSKASPAQAQAKQPQPDLPK